MCPALLLDAVSGFPRPCLPSCPPFLFPFVAWCFPASRGLVSLLSLLVSLLVVGCCVHLPERLSSFLSPFFSLCLSPFLFPFVGCCFRLLEALCDLSSFLSPFLFPVVGCCIRALEALSLLSPFLSPLLVSVCCMVFPASRGLVSLLSPSCLSSCCRMLCPPSRALVFLLVSLLFFVLVSLLVSVCWMLLPPSGGLVWLVFLPVSLLLSRCWMLYPSFGGLVSLVSLLVSLCCMLCPPTQGLLSLASSPLVGWCWTLCLPFGLPSSLPSCVPLLDGASTFPTLPSGFLVLDAVSAFWTPCLPFSFLFPFSLLVSLLVFLFWLVRALRRLVSFFCIRSCFPFSDCGLPFGGLVCLSEAMPLLSPFLFAFVGCCVRLSEALCPLCLFLFPLCWMPSLPSRGIISLFPFVSLCCVHLSEALPRLSPFLSPCFALSDAVSAFARPPLSPLLFPLDAVSFPRPCLSLFFLLLCWMLRPPFRGLVTLLVSLMFSVLLDAVSAFQRPCLPCLPSCSPMLDAVSALPRPSHLSCFRSCFLLLPFPALCCILCLPCQGLVSLPFLSPFVVKLCCLFFQRRCLPSLPSCPPSFFTLLDVVSEALSPFFFPFLGSCVRVPDAVSAFLFPFASPFLSRFWFPFVGCCVRLSGAVSPFLLPLCGMPPPHLVSLVPPSCIVSLDWMLWPPFGGLVFLASLHVSFVLDAVSAFRRPCLPCLSSCFPCIGSRASAFRKSSLCSCFRSCVPVVGCRVAIPRPCLPCIACCSQQQEAVGFQFLEARGGIAFRLLLIIRSGNLGPLPPSVSHFVSRLCFPFTTLETCLPALSPSLSLLSVALCLTPANSCNLVCRFVSQLGSLCVVFFSVCRRVSPPCLPACLPVCVPSGNCFPPFRLLVSQLVSHGVPYVSPTWNLGTLPAALSFTSSPTCLPACLSLCRTLSLEPCLPLCLPPCLPLALQPFLFPTLFPPGCSWACFPLCLPGGTLSTTGSSTVFLNVFPGFPTWTLSAAVSPLELWEPCLCGLFCLRLSLPPLLSQLSPTVSPMVASKSSPVVFLLSACSCSLSPNLSHLCPTSVSQLVSCFCVFHYSAMSLTVSFSLSPVLFPTLFPLGLKLCLWLCLPACLPFYPPACLPLCLPLCLQLVLSPCLLSANCVSIVACFVSHLFQALFPALYPLCPPLCLPLFPTLSLALSPTLSPALSLTLSSAFVCLLLCFPLGDLSGCKASLRSLFPLCLGLCFWLCLPACLQLCLPAYLPLCQLCLNCLRFVSHFFQTFSLPLCLCTA